MEQGASRDCRHSAGSCPHPLPLSQVEGSPEFQFPSFIFPSYSFSGDAPVKLTGVTYFNSAKTSDSL